MMEELSAFALKFMVLLVIFLIVFTSFLLLLISLLVLLLQLLLISFFILFTSIFLKRFCYGCYTFDSFRTNDYFQGLTTHGPTEPTQYIFY